MCLSREYKNHWCKYNEAITHQLNRVRRGSPARFWTAIIVPIAVALTILVFFAWLIIHLLKTPFKERSDEWTRPKRY